MHREHRRFGGWIVGAALVSLSGVASAQTTANANHNGHAVRAQAPGRMSGLGGVKSQPGVHTSLPQPSVPTFGRRPASSVPIGAAGPITITPMSQPLPPPRVIERRLGPTRHDGRILGDQREVVVPVSDGVSISGSHKRGPFSVVFSTGGLGKVVIPRHGALTPIYFGGYSSVLPYGLGSYFGNGSYFSAGYYSSPYSQVGPAPASPQPDMSTSSVVEPSMAVPRTPLERAGDLLVTGDTKSAIAAYQAYLKQNPNDADAIRLLGLSLIDGGRVSDGVAVVGMAYRSDTTLPARPFSVDLFYGGASKVRQHLNRISSYANREDSATGWLTLASFMQAEGRDKQARAMIERARKAGLEDQIVQEMNSALSGADRQTK